MIREFLLQTDPIWKILKVEQLLVSCDGNGVLSSHADIAITGLRLGHRLYKRHQHPLPAPPFDPLSLHADSGLAMASTAKRVGKKIIAYPEDGVPIISTTTYVKGRLGDPKQSVSPKGVTNSPTFNAHIRECSSR